MDVGLLVGGSKVSCLLHMPFWPSQTPPIANILHAQAATHYSVLAIVLKVSKLVAVAPPSGQGQSSLAPRAQPQPKPRGQGRAALWWLMVVMVGRFQSLAPKQLRQCAPLVGSGMNPFLGSSFWGQAEAYCGML